MTHGTALVKALRSRNTYSATSVDQLPHQLLAHLMFGHQLLLPVPDIDRTDYFLVVGANPMASNGSLMTAPDFPQRARELKRRGGHLVVLDPRRTETARIATEHHFVRPGSDAWVLLAMLHVLFADGVATRTVVRRRARRRRAQAVADFTPERAEAMSGVPADGDQPHRPRARRRRERGGLRARRRLHPRVRLGVPVGGQPAQRPHRQPRPRGRGDVHQPGHRRRRARHHRPRATTAPGARGSAACPRRRGELPVSALREEIETPGEGQVRAMLTLSGNPVLSTPDGARLDEALAGLDFMAAVDIYVNETTRHADVILPPTTALERDHYDLVFQTLAVRNTARFTPAVLPAGPGTRHDWQIYRELALRTARPPRPPADPAQAARPAGPDEHQPDPARPAAAALAAARASRCAGSAPSPPGIDLGPLRRRAAPRAPPDPRPPHRPRAPRSSSTTWPGSPTAPAPVAGELLLIGRRHQQDCNAWMHNVERLTRGRPRHQLLMHPDDLAARSLATARRCGSARGSAPWTSRSRPPRT